MAHDPIAPDDDRPSEEPVPYTGRNRRARSTSPRNQIKRVCWHVVEVLAAGMALALVAALKLLIWLPGRVTALETGQIEMRRQIQEMTDADWARDCLKMDDATFTENSALCGRVFSRTGVTRTFRAPTLGPR